MTFADLGSLAAIVAIPVMIYFHVEKNPDSGLSKYLKALPSKLLIKFLTLLKATLLLGGIISICVEYYSDAPLTKLGILKLSGGVAALALYLAIEYTDGWIRQIGRDISRLLSADTKDEDSQ